MKTLYPQLDPEHGTVAAADGTRLAFHTVGQGPPLVLVNGVSTSNFFWAKILPQWASRYRVVLWDYKGHGDSEAARTRAGTSIEAMADDLGRVMVAADVARAPVIGFSMGSQVALEACRTDPDRFPAVVSLLGTSGRVFDRALWRVGGVVAQGALKGTPRAARKVLHRAMHLGMRAPLAYRVGRLAGLFGCETRPDDIAAYIDHFARLDPATVADIVLAAGAHDASDVLADLPMPLLVIAGERDVFAPLDRVGRPIHAAAPGSKLVVIPGGTHGSLFGHAPQIEAAIEAFIDDVLPGRCWNEQAPADERSRP